VALYKVSPDLKLISLFKIEGFVFLFPRKIIFRIIVVVSFIAKEVLGAESKAAIKNNRREYWV